MLVLQVNHFGANNVNTNLVPNLEGVDPDECFSSVPYEKGFALLYHLEELLGGPGTHTRAHTHVIILCTLYVHVCIWCWAVNIPVSAKLFSRVEVRALCSTPEFSANQVIMSYTLFTGALSWCWKRFSTLISIKLLNATKNTNIVYRWLLTASWQC